jgi:hypothetical protein
MTGLLEAFLIESDFFLVSHIDLGDFKKLGVFHFLISVKGMLMFILISAEEVWNILVNPSEVILAGHWPLTKPLIVGLVFILAQRA